MIMLRRMEIVKMNIFSEARREKISFPIVSLWKICFLQSLVPPNNQLQHDISNHRQKCDILAYLQSLKSINESFLLVVNHCYIVRLEIHGSSDRCNGVYKVKLVQEKYENRKQSRNHCMKIMDDLKVQVDVLLKKDYCSKQVTEFMRTKGMGTESNEAIYQYVRKDKEQEEKKLYTYFKSYVLHNKKIGSLPFGRGFIKSNVDTDALPNLVDEKVYFDDCRVDTIIGKNHKGALLTINDRVSRLGWITLLSEKEANSQMKVTVNALKPLMEQIHTMTVDNGKEFRFPKEFVKNLKVFVYFIKLYHLWERGVNENTKGLVRLYFPESTGFGYVTQEQVMYVQCILNSRPRKRFGYMTPKDKYKLLSNKEFAAVALSA